MTFTFCSICIMEVNNVSFSELKNYNDSESLVFIGVIFNPVTQNWDEVNTFLHDIGLIPKGKSLIGVHRITGNVLGDEGRWDYLLRFDHSELQISPIARLYHAEYFKWTSDFITNYRRDYHV